MLLQERRPINNIEDKEREGKEESRHFVDEQRDFPPVAKRVILRQRRPMLPSLEIFFHLQILVRISFHRFRRDRSHVVVDDGELHQ